MSEDGDARRAAVMRMVETLGSSKKFAAAIATDIGNVRAGLNAEGMEVADAEWTAFTTGLEAAGRVLIDRLTEMMVTSYPLTIEEIDETIRFYSSPIGVSILAKTELATAESAAALEPIFARAFERLMP